MSNPEQDWFQAITAAQMGSFSGSFSPVFANGFPDNIKILTVYNGSSSVLDYSFDEVNLAGIWPSGATMIIDLQTNHSDHPPYGSGTLYGRAGQNIWVRTSVNPTYLTIGGFR